MQTRARAAWTSTGSILVLLFWVWSACGSHPIPVGSVRDGGPPADATGNAPTSGADGALGTLPPLFPSECSPVPLKDQFSLGLPPVAMTGEGPVSIVARDFDGDGKLDVATANEKASTVSVLLGKGNGRFEPAVDYVTGAEPKAIVAGDWNRDGRVDLATANAGTDTVSVLLGKRGGGFARQPDIKVGSGLGTMEAEDLDLDGILDLAVISSGDDKLIALYGKGDGTFSHAVKIPTGGSPCSLVCADFNRDGRPDFVVGRGTPWQQVESFTLNVRLGGLERTFTEKPDLVLDDYTYGIKSLTAGDFDGDGKLDLGVSDPGGRGWSSAVAVFVGTGDGTFSSRIPLPSRYPHVAKSADLNGDGRADLVLFGYSSVQVLPGQQRDSPQNPLGDPLESGFTWGDVMTFADLDDDGNQDVVIADNPSSWVLDGRLDLLTTKRYSGQLAVLLGKGDGTFAYPLVYSMGNCEGFAIADLNGDHRPDVVANDCVQTDMIVLLNKPL